MINFKKIKNKNTYSKRGGVKICAIDIGTNSVLYLLAQIDRIGRLTPLCFHAKTTRLGESIRAKGIINPKAQRRTIITIKQFLKDASQKGTIHYALAGTSALREAKNNSKFLRRLHKETEKNLTILTETQEAQLIFSAVNHFLEIGLGKTVITDIGGGSTELIFCTGGKSVKASSIPVGAVNITERFRNNIAEMGKFLKNKIGLYSYRKGHIKLIGVGGTITTLGTILKGLKRYDPKKVHKHTVTYINVIHTIKKLSSLSLARRKRLIPFDPKRADIIIGGLVILKVIMELFNAERLMVCDRGLVYGLALNYSKYTRGTFNLHNTS